MPAAAPRVGHTSALPFGCTPLFNPRSALPPVALPCTRGALLASNAPLTFSAHGARRRGEMAGISRKAMSEKSNDELNVEYTRYELQIQQALKAGPARCMKLS